MWIKAKVNYQDIEGQRLTVEVNDLGGIILEAKEGVFFETKDDFILFIGEIKAHIKEMCLEQ